MKKIFLLAAAIVLLCSACGTAQASETVRITEKLFVAQVNDVLSNQNAYLGKTIALEGMFKAQTFENGGTYYYVYRNGPGCCGNDGQVGFEVALGEGIAKPAGNDWVAAEGRLEKYDENGTEYLHLVLDKLEVKTERGLENVTA